MLGRSVLRLTIQLSEMSVFWHLSLLRMRRKLLTDIDCIRQPTGVFPTTSSHFEYSDDALIFALYYLLNQSKAFELSLKLLAIERTLNYLPSRLNECSIKVDAIEALDAISGGEGIPARALTLTELGPSTPTVLIDRRKSPPLLRVKWLSLLQIHYIGRPNE
ncbi:hypothetical protein RDI58_023627 [Solanum bulbocastanum]|uniref:Uncharacterized protein n=1 Tax=Solanum bulbocastanum TaxID=147425 RepID=A0AAN8SYK5_SOLBU